MMTPISPTNRIREMLNTPEVVHKYAQTIPLEIKQNGAEYPVHRGYAYLFSGENLHKFIDDIVKHTYDETFAMLKRRMNYEEDRA